MSTESPSTAAGIVVPSNVAPVLHLDTPLVELAWGRKGHVHRSSIRVEGSGNAVLVAGAKQLVKQARLGSQGVVLCLASPFFDSRQLLLGNMPADEELAVLSRKAANGIGVDRAECLFWAQRCGTPLENADTTQSTWLVHARRRSDHYDLLLRLRRAGIHVRRTVAGRDVLTHVLDDTPTASGRILVSATGHAVYAHLFRGTELVQESRLQLADFATREDTYTNIIQDVRQLAAFWSKGSRGSALEAVHLFGFSTPEVDQMRQPLGIAAQGADVRLLASPEHGSYDDSRKQLLELFLAYGVRAHDLSIPLPPRASRIALATAGLSLVAGAGAWKLFQHWDARIEDRLQRIEAELVGTDAVEQDDATRNEFLAAESSLKASIASLETLSHRGLPLTDVLRHVYGTLGRIVDVRNIAFEEDEEGTRVVLEAGIADDVTSAAHLLEQLRQGAASDPQLRDVRIEPSSRVPDTGRDEALTFTFTGIYVGGDA